MLIIDLFALYFLVFITFVIKFFPFCLKASTSAAAPSNSNLVDQFLGMGFSEKQITKAIKENGI